MLRGLLSTTAQRSSICAALGRRPRLPLLLPAADGAPPSGGSSARFRSAAAAAAAGGNQVQGVPGQQHPEQQQPEQQALLEPEPAGSFAVTAKQLASQGGSGSKVRLDAFLAAQLPAASRAKISASIRAGLVTVNGRPITKAAQAVKAGDAIDVCLLPPEPCTAIPEAIPLNVVYEDEHLIVINKAPGMVVHLSPGHTTGTLVNALLAHCGLPACDAVPSGSSGGGLMGGLLLEEEELEGDDEDEAEQLPEGEGSAGAGTGEQAALRAAASATTSTTTTSSSNTTGIVRPGIVHRLDRGTSGLMVVAKSDAAHASLCGQFKERSVSRIYNAVTLGAPAPSAARVATNIVRDPANRLRMMAVPYGSGRGRTAASNYATLGVLAGGGAALVEWRLETGRTHQIRVHARHIGHPLLGDDMYAPTPAACARQLVGKRSSLAVAARAALEGFGRPALHARTLGFTHPASGRRLEFDSELPVDFVALVDALRAWE